MCAYYWTRALVHLRIYFILHSLPVRRNRTCIQGAEKSVVFVIKSQADWGSDSFHVFFSITLSHNPLEWYVITDVIVRVIGLWKLCFHSPAVV